MTAQRLLAAMRAGEAPTEDALRAFARGLADGTVSDAQAGAFAMAACWRGLGEGGRVALTEAMRDTGRVMSWDLPGPVLDKHSTGGVGDCISLILAPILATCGVYVPMISGRGLGHTGGTLDKLEALPGLSTDLAPDRFAAVLRDVGCVIAGAGEGIAPADARLYAVRDVTGTVDHVDLIVASILSKKLAAGLEGLVLDVKLGSGAFMREGGAARELAEALVATATGAGCPTVAMITDMDQPLAPAMGNGVELSLCLEVLEGADVAPRLRALAVAQAETLAELSGHPIDAEKALASGAAREVMGRMLHAMGGRGAPGAAPVTLAVEAPGAGHIAAWDGTALGRAVVALGGGRAREGDAIDHRVGLTGIAPLGTALAPGDPVAFVRAADAPSAEACAAAVLAALRIGDPPAPGPLIHDVLRAQAARP
ncbi:MAG: thymidine phosphorylase [Paracoccaceae bacterium]